MEGVLHVGWSPIPGSAAAVAELAAGGIELGVLTNTTGRTRAAIAERLAGIGYELPVERGAVGELDRIELVDDPDTAEVVLLGGPDDSWTYARLNAVFRALLGGV